MYHNGWSYLQSKLQNSARKDKNFYGIERKERKQQKEFLKTDMLAELVKVLGDKTALETEINELRTQNNELSQKLALQKKEFDEERIKSNEDLQKAYNEIQAKSAALAERDSTIFELENKYLLDIKTQQMTNLEMKDSLINKEQEFMSHILALESEITETKTQYTDLKSALDRHNKKANKYKTKLQCALTVIAEQQKLLERLNVKPKLREQSSQTTLRTPSSSTFCNCYQSRCNLEKENAILSQLFFNATHKIDEVEVMFGSEDESEGMK